MPIYKRRPWPKEDIEIPLRALLYDSAQSSDYRDEQALRADLTHRLSATMGALGNDIAEYKDPRTGIWMTAWGEVAGYGSPDLTQDEVRELAPDASRVGVTPRHGEACVWIAAETQPEDLLEAMVLAGWVPSQRGIDLAVAARRYVDSKGAK